MTAVEEPITLVGHPLEPLTAAEIGAAADILRAERGLGATARFVFVELHEPPKAAVLAWSATDEPLPAKRTWCSTSAPSAPPTRPWSPSPTGR